MTPSIKETIERLRAPLQVAVSGGINDPSYVTLDERDARKVMAEAADTIERLAGALEQIEKPTYGTEIFDSDAEIADVYRSHVRRFQHIARRALSGEPTP